MLSEYIEEEHEDVLIEYLQSLGLSINGRDVTIAPLEGNAIDMDNPGDSMTIKSVPTVLVGIVDFPDATPTDADHVVYDASFTLRTVISAYALKRGRRFGKLSDIKRLRRAVRNQLVKNNLGNFDQRNIRLTWNSDNWFDQIDGVVIYVQTYTGKATVYPVS